MREVATARRTVPVRTGHLSVDTPRPAALGWAVHPSATLPAPAPAFTAAAAPAEIARAALDGVLCRCFAHVRILRAIQRYARGMGK